MDDMFQGYGVFPRFPGELRVDYERWKGSSSLQRFELRLHVCGLCVPFEAMLAVLL